MDKVIFQPDPANDNQVLIPQVHFCESPHMWKFAGILYAIKGKINWKLNRKNIPSEPIGLIF